MPTFKLVLLSTGGYLVSCLELLTDLFVGVEELDTRLYMGMCHIFCGRRRKSGGVLLVLLGWRAYSMAMGMALSLHRRFGELVNNLRSITSFNSGRIY